MSRTASGQGACLFVWCSCATEPKPSWDLLLPCIAVGFNVADFRPPILAGVSDRAALGLQALYVSGAWRT